jgi:hypothetical protein
VLQRWDDAIRDPQTRELWWKGIAPRCRGSIWSRAIGNELGLTETSFRAALSRADEAETRVAAGKPSAEDERRMAWFTRLRADIEQHTWPDMNIFQSNGPLNKSLVDVLRAYAMYRSDIGYVTGCHNVAAILLLNLSSPAAAFIAMANILNRPLPLSFYAGDAGGKTSTHNLVLQTLTQKSPKLHQHLTSKELGLAPDEYLADVFTGFFTLHLNLDESTRLWDVYVFEGDAVLIRAAVALLLESEMALLGAKTAEDVKQALARHNKVTEHGKESEWMTKVRSAGKS